MSEQKTLSFEGEIDAKKRLELREAWRQVCDLAAEVLPQHRADFLAGGRSGVVVVVAAGRYEKLLRDFIVDWGGEVEPDPEDPKEAIIKRYEQALKVIAGNPPDAADIARDALR